METASSCLPKRGCLSFRSPPVFECPVPGRGGTAHKQTLLRNATLLKRRNASSVCSGRRHLLPVREQCFWTSRRFVASLFRRDFWRWSSEGCLSFGLHCLDPLPINRLHRRSVPPEGGSRLPRGEFTTSGRRFAQRGKIVTTFEGGVWIVRCVIVRDCACSLD